MILLTLSLLKEVKYKKPLSLVSTMPLYNVSCLLAPRRTVLHAAMHASKLEAQVLPVADEEHRVPLLCLICQTACLNRLLRPFMKLARCIGASCKMHAMLIAVWGIVETGLILDPNYASLNQNQCSFPLGCTTCTILCLSTKMSTHSNLPTSLSTLFLWWAYSNSKAFFVSLLFGNFIACHSPFYNIIYILWHYL